MGLWNWITGTTPQAEQQAQLDAKKQAYNEALLNRQVQSDLAEYGFVGASDANYITPEQVQADQQYVNGVTLEDVDSGARQGFQEGLQEGFTNVLQAPGRAVGFAGNSAGTVLGGILKNIPWWVWVGAAVYLFIAVGGLGLVKRRLAR